MIKQTRALPKGEREKKGSAKSDVKGKNGSRHLDVAGLESADLAVFSCHEVGLKEELLM